MESVADIDALYESAMKARGGVSWKGSVQRYCLHVLENVHKASNDLFGGEDIRQGFHEFDIIERGKPRHISSVRFSERVIHKSLSTNALIPAIMPTLTAGNSANMKGRGVDYAIARLKSQLARHYRRHGSEGYVLLVDFSNYFASIDHDAAKRLVRRSLDDERLVALTESLITRAETSASALEANRTRYWPSPSRTPSTTGPRRWPSLRQRAATWMTPTIST